jgi:hypothetical protein
MATWGCHIDFGQRAQLTVWPFQVYSWNNMANLQKDTTDGTADLVIHMGDHAYNEGMDDERRADGYM